MSLSGLFLCTFLVVHLIGNLQLFKNDGGYAFNTYAVFMTTFPPIKAVSYVNYALILFHAFWGLYLASSNRKARNVGYDVVKNSSTWSSRNMAILGTVLLVYIVVHMSGFWYKYHYVNLPYVQYTETLQTGEVVTQAMPEDYTQDVKSVETVDVEAGTRTLIVKDLYKEVSFSFKNVLIVLIYIVGMVALAYHLYHGFQSAFQSLGANHPKYTPAIKWIGIWIFAILIPVAYALMPLYFFFK